MARYVLGCSESDGVVLYLDENGDGYDYDSNPFFELGFDLANHLDSGVKLKAAVKQHGPNNFDPSTLSLEVNFFDDSTNDVIYRVNGFLNPDENVTSSIVSIMDAMEDFSEVELHVNPVRFDAIADMDLFNTSDSLGRNVVIIDVPTAPVPTVGTVFDIVTNQDIEPSDLYIQFTDDFGLFTQMLRVANDLNVGLWVELDPTLTVEQVLMIADDLAPYDHHVRLLWSPIRARPLDAVGLKGKKIPRHVGGYILAQHLLRRADTNVQGIPPLHRPIAGYDYPIPFAGIEQNPNVVLGDPQRKALAAAQVNVVQRMRYPNGVRFVVSDCLTAYGDSNSILKVTNASDVSMFIDNRIIQIIRRHLLKAMDTMIEDALKECVRFLDGCTTTERKLLVKSEDFGGFYDLSIVPREDRPFDAVAVKCRYRPQGAARAAYLDTEVTK